MLRENGVIMRRVPEGGAARRSDGALPGADHADAGIPSRARASSSGSGMSDQ